MQKCSKTITLSVKVCHTANENGTFADRFTAIARESNNSQPCIDK